jgi:hypothetical protein
MLFIRIIADLFFVAFAVGTIAYSVRAGRLVYRGTTHITRKDDPTGFWFWIGFTVFMCAFAIALPML